MLVIVGCNTPENPTKILFLEPKFCKASVWTMYSDLNSLQKGECRTLFINVDTIITTILEDGPKSVIQNGGAVTVRWYSVFWLPDYSTRISNNDPTTTAMRLSHLVQYSLFLMFSPFYVSICWLFCFDCAQHSGNPIWIYLKSTLCSSFWSQH